MPEKPEVQAFADALHAHIAGRTLCALTFDAHSRYHSKRPAGYDAFCAALPSVITRVWSKGKKVLIVLDNGTAILSSLGMEGKWLPSPGKHSNACLQCACDTVAYYDDVRHQGELEVFLTAEALSARLQRLGPDLLNDDVTLQQWLGILRSARLAHKEICDVMMEQSYFSGIGNYIKAEALHSARVRPNALICELDDAMLAAVFAHSVRVIQESYAARGATLHSYADFDQRPGGFRVLVYNQECDVHKNTVIKTTFADGRTTHWCPAHQVLPSAWTGTPSIDVEKLRRSKGRGKEVYLVHELKEYCRHYGVSQEGVKSVLVDRLTGKLGA